MSSGVSKVVGSGFFKAPPTKTRFLSDSKQSQILSSLLANHTLSTNDPLNGPTTLPLSVKPKAEIHNDVARENPDASGTSLYFKQSFAYAKSLMNFYKIGVKNVWNNHQTMNNLLKSGFKISNHVNNKGKDVAIRIPNFSKLTAEMSQAIYISEVERRTNNENTRGDVIKEKFPQRVDSGLFNLTRSQYQLIKRTPADFYRIPMFGLIFAVFMETTPLVCYAIPEITPSTCILPSMLPKIWNYQTVLQLRDLRQKKGVNIAELSSKTAYNLPIDEVRLLCKSLRITSKYFPLSLYPESWLRSKLQEYYNYLRVDNYYLSGLNGENSGNLWNLSHQELLRAALERQLILDLKEETKHFDEIKDEAEKFVEEEKYFNDLRIKLFQFLVDFEHFNVGYLGVNHLGLEPSQEVLEWRQSLN